MKLNKTISKISVGVMVGLECEMPNTISLLDIILEVTLCFQ